MNGWSRSVWKLPVLSGVIFAFAYFPFYLFVPNFVAFLPILYWLDRNPDASATRRLRAGLFFGMTVHLLILHWMGAMVSFSWLAIPLYLFLASVFGIGVAVSIALAGWVRERTGWTFAVVLPVCWLPVEWLRTWGDTRMTADHVGHTLAGFPFLVQFADLVGPYGVGAFMLVANALLYEAVRRHRGRGGRRRAAVALVLLWSAVLGYDGWSWRHPPAEDGTLRIALIQPDIPLDMKHDLATELSQWQVLSELTREAAAQEADVIVWPETAYPQPVYHRLGLPRSYAIPDVQLLAREIGATIVTGVEYVRIRNRTDFDLYNAAMAVHRDGTLDPVWTAKVYLVPFTEGIPFEAVLGPLLSEGEGELRWMAGGFTAGPRATPLPVEDILAGVLVCYEELYWDLARDLRNAGAGIQFIITNDAWFGRTVIQSYMANTVSMRAIENRSAFVRVANTGISGFVDPLGRYHRRTGLFERAVEVFDVPITSGQTVYDRIGDVVALVALIGLAILVIASWLASARVSEAGGDLHEQQPD